MNLPTEDDWGDYKSDRDTLHAYKIFSGKKIEGAINEFKKNPINRCDDLRWMPLIPFQYYLLAYRDYILLGDFSFSNKADSANCFIELIKETLLGRPEFILPIFEELMPALSYIANNQKLFDADIDIYGNFADELKRIKELKEHKTR